MDESKVRWSANRSRNRAISAGPGETPCFPFSKISFETDRDMKMMVTMMMMMLESRRMEMDDDGKKKEGGDEAERIPAYLQTTTQHFPYQCQHAAANDCQINSL